MLYTRLSAPINIQWELTSWCNYRCVHCYNYWRNTSEAMPVVRHCAQPTVSSMDIAREIIDCGVFHVTLTGGEPLAVLKRDLPAFIELKRAGVGIGINTNLSLLTPELAELLQRIGTKSILTSLMSTMSAANDRLAGKDGAFLKTLAGIKLAVNSGFRVSVNMVVTKKNTGSVRGVAHLAHDLGASAFCATKATKPPACKNFSEYHLSNDELEQMFQDLLWVKEHLGLDVDSLEHYGACAFGSASTRAAFGSRICSAGKTSCSIGFDGKIRPCSHATNDYGRISDGLRTAWARMDEWRDGSLVPEKCKRQCKEFPKRCSGGCRVEAFNSWGNLNADDPFCKGPNNSPAKEQRTKPTWPITTSDRFVRRSDIKFRHEQFGRIAYLSPKRWLLIDDILGDFLTGVRYPDGYTARDIAEAYRAPETQALPTLQLLVLKGLVNRSN